MAKYLNKESEEFFSKKETNGNFDKLKKLISKWLVEISTIYSQFIDAGTDILIINKILTLEK